MSDSVLTAKHFHDEAAAYAFVEARVWANGVVCPHCGNADQKKLGKLTGKSTRIGVRKCYACRKPFTVKVGTIFESSHIPLHLWLQAVFLMASSKKGISTQQLHRTLGVTLKSAWFLSHRIREAMRVGEFAPMGGAGGVVEIDETYIGKPDNVSSKQAKLLNRRGGTGFKNMVLTLVERGGSARSFHIDGALVATVLPIVNAHIDRESKLMTDEAKWYPPIGVDYAEHHTVNHGSKEYVRGPVTTNTVEGFYSIFKRGMKGIYQHCSEKHLHRYLSEFDFRYSNRVALGVDDLKRADRAIIGAVGKRLTYQTTRQQ
jgi:transposase-like protein